MTVVDTTPVGQPDASQLNAAGPAGAVEPAAPESMTLVELNEYLGKDFKDKPTALKSLKDTFSYVGKKTEDIEKEIIARNQDNGRIDKLASELATERKERFYDRNPQYATPDVRKLIERIGGEPTDVVNSDEFKTVFVKISGFDESQKLKTVLDSNPRLASSRDALTRAQEMRGVDGKITDEGQALIARAVLDVSGK